VVWLFFDFLQLAQECGEPQGLIQQDQRQDIQHR
jgi:hypothetical protein